MKIYLDIDGVLLNSNYEQMPYVKEFINCVFDISKGEVYWLTTHCKDGTSDRALEHIIDIVDPDIFEMLKRVIPTKWNTFKTEGIDLESEFLWFDDNIFQSEYSVLEGIGKEYCLIKVKENLKELVELLREEEKN